MALALLQKGTGGALVVCAGPMPKKKGTDAWDTETPWGLPRAALAALGPRPCVVGCNARGDETMEQIMAFAQEKTGRQLWPAVLLGFSAGCMKVRALWLAGAAALALVLADGLHAHNPPSEEQLAYGRAIVAQGRAGTRLTVIAHTYIDTGKDITSTAAMARTLTGWPLAMPPLGQTLRRVEPPSPPPAGTWSGALVVYSTGSGPADRAAHEAQALRVLPLALAAHVRQLVDLDLRPSVAEEVVAADAPASTPEPPGEVVLDAGGVPNGALPPRGGASRSEAPSAPSNGGTILLLGDSLALGLDPPLGALARGVPCRFRSMGKLGSRVPQWASGGDLAVAMGAPAPALVLVCLGTNDMRTSDPAGAGAEAGVLCDRILQAGAPVAWIAPPRLGFDDGRFRPALVSECGKRNVRIYDSTQLDLERAADGVHLTPKGYRAWAEAIAAWVPFSAYTLGAAQPGVLGAAGPVPAALALVALRAQLDATWPDRSRAADGVAPSAAHHVANPASDHEGGNALDITLDSAHGPDLDALGSALLRDSRVHYVIWRRRIANPEKEGGAWRPYPGQNPHEDHLHVSIYPDRRDDAGAWDLGVAGGGATVEPLAGVALPALRPFGAGEGRRPVDRTASLGERAISAAFDEQRARVTDGPRIEQYRRGMGSQGQPWDAAAFCFCAHVVLNPGEVLPHAYSPYVSVLVREATFRSRASGYGPRFGDGVVWSYRGDPRQGGQGRIGRISVPPDAAGQFETIEGDAAGTWQVRQHRLDEPTLLGWLAYPTVQQASVPRAPDALVVEDFGRLALEDYVARVVTAEIGMSRQPQALAALAMAARSYAAWMWANEGLGTADKPLANSQRKQVAARVATPLCVQAARATRGGLVLHRGRVVLTSHVAGAVWPPGATNGRNGKDDTQTEHLVTYNDGLVSRAVVPSPIASATHPDNRGCLSQNGAIELARRGYDWPAILRFSYGADIEFTCPEPVRRSPSPLPQKPGPGAAPGRFGPRPAAEPPPSGGSDVPVLLAAAVAAYRVFG